MESRTASREFTKFFVYFFGKRAEVDERIFLRDGNGDFIIKDRMVWNPASIAEALKGVK